jgi:hypothetical protein
MHSPTSIADRSEETYISTGHLPEPERVQRLVSEAHARFKSNTEGENSQVYPALARVPGELFGVGQGSLVTLVFNVLVTASPKELAGDVGSLRGTTQNLAAAVGTAVAGALMVGLLSAIALGGIAASPKLTPELQAQVDLDSINFISNDRLQEILAGTTASPAQVAEAVRVNTEARLRALKIGLLVMAGLAFLTIFPASRLPDYRPGELPAEPPPRR